ncbi:MAG: glycosyltransferase family 4 protein [Bacteroidales bacterium]|nr:glycosyltransferase family 4 protein [Bacteroidales bacterium]
MRIGFDAKRAYCNTSGLGNYSRSIISAMIACEPRNQYFLFVPKADRHLYAPGGVTEVSAKYAPTGWLWRYMQMGKTAGKLHLDVFHGLSNELPKDIGHCHAKKIVTVHDTIFMRYPQWYKWHDRYMYEHKTAWACKAADTVIAISEQTKNDLVHYFHVPDSKIEVVYQPCNRLFCQKPAEEELRAVKEKFALPEQYVLMVGNIEPRKNILSVIKAMEKQQLSLPLVIVGKETRYALQLKAYVKENGLSGIYFYHHVDNQELASFYTLAQMLVYVSWFEGFGIPIVEAMHSGTPVITGNHSCFQETAGKAALYADVENIDDIAEKISTLANDTSLQKTMTAEGYEQVKKFDADKIARQILQLYEK